MTSGSDQKNIAIEQFTQQAVPFAQIKGRSLSGAFELYRKLAEISSDDTVLDVACGPGLVACAFAGVAKHVTGIDITPAMLQQAAELQESKGLTNVTWQLGDVPPLPFENDSFSIVFTRFSFHHFMEPGRVFEEMVRVCRPGGIVMVVDVAMPRGKVDAYNRLERLRDPSHTRAMTVEEFCAMVAKMNLRDVKTGFHKVELELEAQLRASFPNPGDEEKIRQMFIDDLDRNALGLSAHRRDGAIWYTVPVLALAGRKQLLSLQQVPD